jgi:hypothetical protein
LHWKFAMPRLFRRFAVYFTASFLALFAPSWIAARSLITPDLSGLVQRQQAKIHADPTSGFLYLYDFGNSAHGVAFPGIVRLHDNSGQIDADWKPKEIDEVRDVVVGADGDVFVLGRTRSDQRSRLLRFGRNAPATLKYDFGTTPEFGGNEWFVGLAHNPIASEVGDRSDRWLYVLVNVQAPITSEVTRQIVRFDTATNQLDPNWRVNSDSLMLTSNGEVMTYQLESPSAGVELISVLRIYSNDAPARRLCERREADKQLYDIKSDGAGGAYMVAYSNNSNSVIRIDRNCSLASNPLQGVTVPTGQFGGSFFVANGLPTLYRYTTFAESAEKPRSLFLSQLDFNGKLVSSSSVSDLELSYSVEHAAKGTVSYIATRTELLTFDARTMQLMRRVALPLLGSPSRNLRITLLDSGEQLISGRFEATYAGVSFSKLLKLRRNGVPDISWRPPVRFNINDSGGYGLMIDPSTSGGVVLASSFIDENGDSIAATHARVDYSTAQVQYLDWRERLPFSETFDPVRSTAYDGGNFLYRLNFRPNGSQPQLERYSINERRIDPDWKIELPKTSETSIIRYDRDIGVKADGAVWVSLRGRVCFLICPISHFLSFPIAFAPGNRPTHVIPARQFVTLSDVHVSPEYVYHERERFSKSPANGATIETLDLTPTIADTAWRPAEARLHAIESGYAYFYVAQLGLDGQTTSNSMSRAPLSGSGNFDPNWKVPLPFGYIQGGSVFRVSNPNDGAALVAVSGVLPVTLPIGETDSFSNLALVPLDTRTNATREVVEYYHAGIDRYFITGIPGEQAALDSAPQFGLVRTGMRFSAKDAFVTEDGLSPVCRFYSAPAKGGSNSHFFAQGDTCLWGRLWTSLQPEGFDFSVVPPVNGVCPVSAPHAVTRLFNNRGATNNGNHRYIVSNTTKQRMLARGWLDEGVVFCAGNVRDAPQ